MRHAGKGPQFSDIDADGDIDVLAASRFESKIHLYRNNGAQSFTEEVVDGGLFAIARTPAAEETDTVRM